jgi:hypothetical protein
MGMVERLLVSRLLWQAQALAVAALGSAVLLPFVFVPAVIGLVAAVLLLGPAGVARLARRH